VKAGGADFLGGGVAANEEQFICHLAEEKVQKRGERSKDGGATELL
jgi:hypothetical protein